MESRDNLLSLIPKSEMKRVLNQEHCDIDPTFMGFIDIYFHLSKIIPKHFTVVDLGCAYNPQCYFFKDHKKYVGVDYGSLERFKSINCEIFEKTISDFLKYDAGEFDPDETFYICSFVPPWGDDNQQLARIYSKNCFCFYPSHKEQEKQMASFMNRVRRKTPKDVK